MCNWHTLNSTKRYKCSDPKGHVHPNVYSSNVHNNQTMERTQMSINRWIKKMWYIYTMEYYAAIKRNEILPFTTTWMELEGIMLSEISQSEKDNYHMISLIWGSGDATWGLKWVGEESMKQDGIGRETNHKWLLISQNKLRVAGGRGFGRRERDFVHWGGYVLWWVLWSV